MKKFSVPVRILALLLSLLFVTVIAASCQSKTTPDTSSVTAESEEEVQDTEESELPSETASEEVSETSTEASKATTTSKNNTSSKTATPSKALDIATAAMPTTTIKNKTVVVFNWEELKVKYSAPKSAINMFKQEFGVTFKEEIVSHNDYWEALKVRKASGNMPDLVKLPNWKYYPQPIVDKTIQPLDPYVDFSDPIWNDSTKAVRERYIWKGKTYMPVNGENLDSWVFYNKKMMRDAGVAKDPEALYKAGNWTYDEMEKIVKKTTLTDNTGKITQSGIVLQTSDLIASTGIELITADGKGGATNNLGHANVTKFMNLMHSIGDGGSKSYYWDDARTGFAKSKVAMIVTQAYSATSEFNDLRLAGNLGWVPMPKMDANSKNYLQTALSPGFAIAEGAKNPEAAGLYISYEKWFTLGSQFTDLLPKEKRNAADTKYKTYEVKTDPNKTLTKAEQEYTKTLITCPAVTQVWQSWLGGSGAVPGIERVLHGEAWSKVYPEVNPEVTSLLKMLMK